MTQPAEAAPHVDEGDATVEQTLRDDVECSRRVAAALRERGNADVHLRQLGDEFGFRFAPRVMPGERQACDPYGTLHVRHEIERSVRVWLSAVARASVALGGAAASSVAADDAAATSACVGALGDALPSLLANGDATQEQLVERVAAVRRDVIATAEVHEQRRCARQREGVRTLAAVCVVESESALAARAQAVGEALAELPRALRDEVPQAAWDSLLPLIDDSAVQLVQSGVARHEYWTTWRACWAAHVANACALALAELQSDDVPPPAQARPCERHGVRVLLRKDAALLPPDAPRLEVPTVGHSNGCEALLMALPALPTGAAQGERRGGARARPLPALRVAEVVYRAVEMRALRPGVVRASLLLAPLQRLGSVARSALLRLGIDESHEPPCLSSTVPSARRAPFLELAGVARCLHTDFVLLAVLRTALATAIDKRDATCELCVPLRRMVGMVATLPGTGVVVRGLATQPAKATEQQLAALVRRLLTAHRAAVPQSAAAQTRVRVAVDARQRVVHGRGLLASVADAEELLRFLDALMLRMRNEGDAFATSSAWLGNRQARARGLKRSAAAAERAS